MAEPEIVIGRRLVDGDWTTDYIEAGGGEGGSGSSSLTDLTDVTGEPGPGKSPVADDEGMFPLVPVTTHEDLQSVLDRVAAVVWGEIGADDGPPFLSQFRNIGDPWATAAYRLFANSSVQLRGTVMCQDQTIGAATWIPIFQLPPECAPSQNLEFGVLTNDEVMSKVYVWDDGLVIWGGYAVPADAEKPPVSRLPLNGLVWSTRGPV